ncbi:MAG: phosphate ABC transporter permease PstA [Firmicutes bacterium]|nr:phosphate ABC transporter permease PstA [Bacillota bacterium]
MRKRKGNKIIKSAVFFGSVRLAAAVTLGILALLLLFILVKGVPHLSLKFLAESPENMGKEGGIFPVLIGTVYVTLTSVLIAMPLGVAAAVYFSEYAGKGRLVHIIRFFTEVLAGIPSIIFGLFGFAFFVVFLGMGWSVIAGGITLSMMILPTLIRSTEEALKTVPGAYREGSLSLGATKWQTVVKVILPCCRSGILTGLILGIGRAIGETAAVMLTVGGSLKLPVSIFDSTRTMSLHLYMLASEGLSQEKTYATAALLILIVLGINWLAGFIGRRLTKE